MGGVILFSRNFESVEQVSDLIADIRALRSPPLLVAVDHEGGRVQRFRDGFTVMPPMARVGHEYDRDPAAGLNAARDAGWAGLGDGAAWSARSCHHDQSGQAIATQPTTAMVNTA